MSSINTMEVVILDDKLPRTLTILVKVPGEATRTMTSYWDTAASQFTPAVSDGLNKLVSGIINRHGLRKKKP